MTAPSRPARQPAISERDFQRQVTDLAELLGWQWAHFRPAQTSKGWRTPVSGPLGAGWPDLVLVRVRDRRLIFAELKRDGKEANRQQVEVLNVLHACPPGVGVFVWRPSEFDRVAAALA